MTRGINSATKAALAEDGFSLCTLVQIDFPTVVRLTDADRNISAMAQTFISSGHLLSVGATTESTDLRVNSMKLELSGAEQTYAAIFLGGEYIDRWVTIWRAVLDGSDGVIGSPILYFKGLISGYEFTENDGDSTIHVEVSSHWKDFEKVSGRKTNHNSQQMFFPGDMGLEFSARIIKDIRWGRK